ncbi:hypothetical protein GCM10007385_20970 [Tateyamaria omphalii]|nr:hypothetical protein GCM10007385_20970 [Tateyamaria omphalii]
MCEAGDTPALLLRGNRLSKSWNLRDPKQARAFFAHADSWRRSRADLTDDERRVTFVSDGQPIAGAIECGSDFPQLRFINFECLWPELFTDTEEATGYASTFVGEGCAVVWSDGRHTPLRSMRYDREGGELVCRIDYNKT